MKVLVLTLFCVASVLSAPQLKIVGGDAGQITDYPYNVAILEDGGHVCGGALISEKFAVTAAQCVANTDGTVKDKSYSIRYGSNDHMSGGSIIKASSVIVPGLYSVYDYDIALLQLDDNVKFGDKVKAVDLPDADSKVLQGTKGNITGWGAIKEGSESMVMQLQVVELQVLDQQKCEVYGKEHLNERILCVGTDSAGKGPCTMDQGDPLVSDGKLIGIVSQFSGCGKEGYPGLYTNVAAHGEWIRYYTNP